MFAFLVLFSAASSIRRIVEIVFGFNLSRLIGKSFRMWPGGEMSGSDDPGATVCFCEGDSEASDGQLRWRRGRGCHKGARTKARDEASVYFAQAVGGC
jgi:hypothetical protein